MKISVRNDEDDTLQTLEAPEGWSLMEVLRDYGLPIKAECGGACCCATCHVYVDEDWLEQLPAMKEEEEDMLDLAPDVTDQSRLSCQIVLEPELDGLTVRIVKID